MDERDVYLSQDYICSITPAEFEEYCKDILLAYAESEKLLNFKITHDKKLTAYDGTYQIDIYAEFVALGSEIKVICECKQYTSSVTREKVVILADKIKSIGVHSGLDNKNEFYSHSNGTDEYNEDAPLVLAEKKLPSYFAVLFSAEADEPTKIYPSVSMIDKIYFELFQQLKKIYGINLDFLIKQQRETPHG